MRRARYPRSLIQAKTGPERTNKLVWVYEGPLDTALDAATWIESTRELRKSGWEVTLIISGPYGPYLIQGVETFRIPRPDTYILRQVVYHIRILRFLVKRKEPFDILLFHTISAPWFAPVMVARILLRRRRPLLAMDIRSLHMPPKKGQGWKGRVREIYERTVIRLANFWVDGFLVITRRLAKAVSIPQHRLWGVWSSGADVEAFSTASALRHWPGRGQAIQLIYIGALHVERNLRALCEAVETVNREGLSFSLQILGEGTDREELERLARASHGRISVYGPVPHEELPEIMSKAHLGVLPFPDEEKFRVSSPIKLFEYIASGLPILATRIACHTDVVGSAHFAFWAERSNLDGLADALRSAWRSSDQLGIMGAEARLAARSWTWKAAAEDINKALRKGLEERP